MQPAKKQEPAVIKKYANRRLYDTDTSAYITLEDLCRRVKNGREFVVVDAKTGHDLTRQVLTQIIFEQETKGYPLLPIGFLRTVIRFYDDKMQDVLQRYLDASMTGFIENQDRMKTMFGKTTDFTPLGQFEEMTKQNVAFIEKAMSNMFSFGNYFTPAEKQEDIKPTKRSKRV